MQVLFIKRRLRYFPGANPIMGDEDAKKLIAEGVCIPYSDEARTQVQALVAAAEKEGAVCEEVKLPKAPAKAKSDDK